MNETWEHILHSEFKTQEAAQDWLDGLIEELEARQ